MKVWGRGVKMGGAMKGEVMKGWERQVMKGWGEEM